MVDRTTSAGVKAGEILVQEMKLVLIPSHGVQEYGVTASPIDDSIAETVAAIKSALEEPRTSEGFSLPEALISLKFTVTKEGNIAIPVGSYSRKSVLAHELVLTVKSRGGSAARSPARWPARSSAPVGRPRASASGAESSRAGSSMAGA